MRFISPKIDYAFKKIFGSNQSQDILISFLNAIIYDGKNKIKSLKIIELENQRQLGVLLDDKSTVIIEMKTGDVESCKKQVLQDVSKIYSADENYLELRPVISLTISDRLIFSNSDRTINQFVFQERQDGFEYHKEKLCLIFVQLPNFKKTLSELETLTDKWIYFIKEAAVLEEIPPTLREVPEIEKALNLANEANFTVEKL